MKIVLLLISMVLFTSCSTTYKVVVNECNKVENTEDFVCKKSIFSK